MSGASQRQKESSWNAGTSVSTSASTAAGLTARIIPARA